MVGNVAVRWTGGLNALTRELDVTLATNGAEILEL